MAGELTGNALSIAIRPAEAGDLLELAGLVHAHIEQQRELSEGAFELELDIDWCGYVRARLARGPQARIFVAVEHPPTGRIIGYVDARVREPGQTSKCGPLRSLRRILLPSLASPSPRSIVRPTRLGVLDEVHVAPDRRRCGVATLLVRRAIEWLQDTTGGCDIEFSIWAANEASRALAQRLGFTASRVTFRRSVRGGSPRR